MAWVRWIKNAQKVCWSQIARDFLIFFFHLCYIYIQQSPSTTLEIQAVNSFTVTSSWKLSPTPPPILQHLLSCIFYFLFMFMYAGKLWFPSYYLPTLIGFLLIYIFFPQHFFFLSHKWLFSFMTLSFFFLFILRSKKKFLLLKIRRAKDFLFILLFFPSFLILEGLKRRGWSDYFLNAIDFFFCCCLISSFTNWR